MMYIPDIACFRTEVRRGIQDVKLYFVKRDWIGQ